MRVRRVYEVGPGPGGLTRALLDTGARVIAVERDRRCIPALGELQEQFGERLRVVQGDALTIDERAEAGDGAHVVANLPYNVGTALLLRWLTTDVWPPWWRSLTLMFQKEVAERIVAAAGSDAYGRLSVAAQWRSRGPDRDDGQPLRLCPAAESHLGNRPHRPESRAGRRRRREFSNG